MRSRPTWTAPASARGWLRLHAGQSSLPNTPINILPSSRELVTTTNVSTILPSKTLGRYVPTFQALPTLGQSSNKSRPRMLIRYFRTWKTQDNHRKDRLIISAGRQNIVKICAFRLRFWTSCRPYSNHHLLILSWRQEGSKRPQWATSLQPTVWKAWLMAQIRSRINFRQFKISHQIWN